MAYVHKNSLLVSLAPIAFALLIFFSTVANASSSDDIVFPVQELGNCKNEAECRAFCDKPANSRTCLSFVKKHNLLSQKEIANWEKFIDVVADGGPGGYHTEAEIRAYCDDAHNITECLAFVKKYDLVSEEKLLEMGKVAKALEAGATLPGGCKNKDECIKTCENKAAYINECVEFAEKGDFITQEQAREARKFAPLIAAGKTPGGCTRKDKCESYCAESVHATECLEFALQYDLVPPDKLETARKVLPFMKNGEMPGGCTNKKGCEDYCNDDSHFKECVDFAEKAGMIDKEEADMARKIGGKGPNGCKSSQDCENFCSKPENQTACIDFAKEHDLISQDELKYVDQLGDFHLCFENLNQEARSCFEEKLGKDALEQMLAGQLPFRTDVRERVNAARSCIQTTDSRLEKIPAEIRSCLEQKIGSDILGKISTGNLSCKDMSLLKPNMDICVAEFKTKVVEKARACTAKPSCREVTSCAQALKAETGERGEGEEFQLPSDVMSRITACVQELQKGGGSGASSGDGGSQQPISGGYRTSPVANACYKRLYGGDVAPFNPDPSRVTSVAGCLLGTLNSLSPAKRTDHYCSDDSGWHCRQATAAYCRDFPEKCEAWIDKLCRTGIIPGRDVSGNCQKERETNCPSAEGDGCGRLTPRGQEGFHSFSLEERLCVKRVYGQDAISGVFVPPTDWQQKIASCRKDYRVCSADYRAIECNFFEDAFGINSLSPEPEVPPEFQGGHETPQAPMSAPSSEPSSQYFDYKPYCPQFESAPSCSYTGAPGTQSYDLCKKCFPNK